MSGTQNEEFFDQTGKGYNIKDTKGRTWAPEQSGNTFVATTEWQEIQPGQKLPPGLKINLDIATGKRYAKLLPKNEKIVEDLAYIQAQIDAGVNLDAQDAKGLSLLHRAAVNGELACAKLLVESKANVNLMTNGRASPLHLSIQYGKTEVAKFLATKSNLKQANKLGHLPLHLAASKGNVKVCEFLLAQKAVKLNAKNSDGDTALHLAGQSGHKECVRFFIDRDADVEIKNCEGKVAAEVCEDYEQEEIANMLKAVLSERALNALMDDLDFEDDKTSKKKKKKKNKPKPTPNPEQEQESNQNQNQSKKGGKKNRKNRKKGKKQGGTRKAPETEEKAEVLSLGGGGSGLAVAEPKSDVPASGGGVGGGLVISDHQPIQVKKPVRNHAAAKEESESESEDDGELDLCGDLD